MVLDDQHIVVVASNGLHDGKQQLHDAAQPGHRRLPSDPTAAAYSPRNSTDGSSQEAVGANHTHDILEDDSQAANVLKQKRSLFGFRKKTLPPARASDTGVTTDASTHEGVTSKNSHHRRWSSLENVASLSGFTTAPPVKDEFDNKLDAVPNQPNGSAPNPQAEESSSWFRRRSKARNVGAPGGLQTSMSDTPGAVTTPTGEASHQIDCGVLEGALATIVGSPAPNSMSCLVGLLPAAPKNKSGSGAGHQKGATTASGVTSALLALEESSVQPHSEAAANGHKPERNADDHEDGSSGANKKGKKPARSLSALLPKLSFRRSDSNVDLGTLPSGDGLSSHSSEPADSAENPSGDGAAGDQQGAVVGTMGPRLEPPSPAGKASADSSKARRCFARPVVLDEVESEGESEEVSTPGAPLPPGIVGFRNLGNTCFVNAAVQCLRFTPGLLDVIAADLAAGGSMEGPALGTAGEKGLQPGAPDAAQGPGLSGSPEVPYAQEGSATEALPPTAPMASPTIVVAGPTASVSSTVSSEMKRASAFFALSERSASVSANSETQVNGVANHPGIWLGSRQNSLAVVKESPVGAPGAYVSPTVPAAALQSVMQQTATTSPPGDGLQASVNQMPGPQGPQPEVSVVQAFEGAIAAPSGSLARLFGSGTALRRDSLVYDDSSNESTEVPISGPAAPAGDGTDTAQCCTCSPRPSVQLLPADGCAHGNPADPASGSGVDAVPASAPASSSGTETVQGSGVPGTPGAPMKGAVLSAFKALLHEMYRSPHGSAIDTASLFNSLKAVPGGSDLCDGGQHDCQEVLRVLLDGLHADLTHSRTSGTPGNSSDRREAISTGNGMAVRSPVASPSVSSVATAPPDSPKESTALMPNGPSSVAIETEVQKANRLWRQYLAHDNSEVTALFGGQLQSSVLCHKCNTRFTMYEPFWDLSLPLGKEAKSGALNWFASKPSATLHDCLQAFTADEVLQGDEAFHCDKCKERCTATKRMRLQRLPKVLVLHIKRFKYKSNTREKLTANVAFPLRDLKLRDFLSDEAQTQGQISQYDLYAVSHHVGNMVGGHYTATCRVTMPNGKSQWWTFNDDVVQRISPQAVVSNSAYMLFYMQRAPG